MSVAPAHKSQNRRASGNTGQDEKAQHARGEGSQASPLCGVTQG